MTYNNQTKIKTTTTTTKKRNKEDYYNETHRNK